MDGDSFMNDFVLQEHFYNLCMTESSRRDSERDQTRVSLLSLFMRLHVNPSFMDRESTPVPVRAQFRNHQTLYPLGCDSAKNTVPPFRRRFMSYFTHCRHMSTSTVDFWLSGYRFQSFIVPRKNHRRRPSHRNYSFSCV